MTTEKDFRVKKGLVVADGGSFGGAVTADSFTGDGTGITNLVPKITTNTTPPVSPTAGDLWWNGEEGQLKIYYNDGDSSQWVDATNAGSAPGYTGSQGITGYTGSAGTTRAWIGSAFTSAEGLVTKNSTVYFVPLGGGKTSTTIALGEIKSPFAGTLRNFNVYVSQNTTAGTSNYARVLVNGVATSIVITWTTATGWVSDTTNSANINAGDLITFAINNTYNSTGSQNIVVESISLGYQ